MVELEATNIRFLSPGDERAFFAWLDALPCVTGYEGRGATLYVSVNVLTIDENDLREMLALFCRYGVDLRQLSLFDRDEFADWFRNEQAYWYKDVFS